jgi:hypothetical protein
LGGGLPNCKLPSSGPPSLYIERNLLFRKMATFDEVRTAEKSMRAAEKALRDYLDSPSCKQDANLHDQLAADLKAATTKYVNLVLLMN